ncbi:MAG: serine/threonine-protein kinase [Oscillospiraceae bacterium]|nr:serine/threonine-protein kinase [Oscillospiraceae bacterium]
MDKIAEAILENGTKLQYVITDNPPKGGMKYTYFSPDKSYVIQFFNDPDTANNPNVKKRIERIIGKYNPTLSEQDGGANGNTKESASYFLKKFCWPTAIVKYPEFGIVCPAYPENFFFDKDSSEFIDLNGKDKKSNWFTSKNRKYLSEKECGNFRSMLQMSISLARSIRRLHQAGLAHSDLSCNNVLIDPSSGDCVVIDIDSLVVPGIFPPEVAGTRGYIAPEVLESMRMSADDENRKTPSTYTDLHAMSVLIYEYLLLRHPLIGPKIYSSESAEEDDFLALGSKATFIENPYDTSNRPKELGVTIKDLGPYLENLFIRAFVDGLHNPSERPTAMEWEKGLVKTWDLLHKCENPNCLAEWFILHDTNKAVCPFCEHSVKKDDIIRLHLKKQLRGKCGQWIDCGVIDVYDNMPLFKWHIFSDVFPDEKADRDLQAYTCKYQGQWILVNYCVKGMTSPSGNLVPARHAVSLSDGAVFRASSEENGFLISVTAGK